MIGIIYLRIVKIPIWCFACEEEGEWTRCVSDTGKGTITCDIHNEVQEKLKAAKDVYYSVKNEFLKIGDALMVPIHAIQSGIDALSNAFDVIASGIPKIPNFEIPSIPEFSCGIDFSKIPSFDPCIALNAVVNGLIYPINKIGDGIEATINGIISGINAIINTINSVPGISVRKLSEIDIPNIGNINESCSIDIGRLISNAIKSSTLDICKGITKIINNGIIFSLNKLFEIIISGINIAIEFINKGIKIVINGIKDGILSAITALKNQLEGLNIFRGLTKEFAKLIAGVKSLRIGSIIYLYILPFFDAIIPGVRLTDVFLILIIMIMLPIVMPLLIVLFLFIDLVFP